jgi:hypothetical protein
VGEGDGGGGEEAEGEGAVQATERERQLRLRRAHSRRTRLAGADGETGKRMWLEGRIIAFRLVTSHFTLRPDRPTPGSALEAPSLLPAAARLGWAWRFALQRLGSWLPLSPVSLVSPLTAIRRYATTPSSITISATHPLAPAGTYIHVHLDRFARMS